MHTDGPVATDDLRAYADGFRAWLDALPADDLPEGSGGRAWQRRLHAGGWVGVAWPARFGGQDLTYAHQFVITEVLAEYGLPQPVGIIGLEVVGPTLLRSGTDAQRERFVRPMLDATDLWCQGFSEPDAGSDLAALRTEGRREGDGFVVTGHKVWSSWADEADWCAALVRTERGDRKHVGISYLLIDLRSPGIEVRPIVQPTGDAEFSEIVFDEVHVPADQCLGAVGRGWELAMDTLSNERSVFAVRRSAQVTVRLERVVSAIVAAAGDADLDDATLIDIGDAYVASAALRGQAHATRDRVLSGSGPSPLDSVDKLLLGTLEQRVARALLDAVGTTAVDRAASVGDEAVAGIVHDYVHSRSATIYGGTSQIQRNIIAQRMLGLPRT